MLNNKPEVSIGMPIYNAEKYLRESLDSLLSQSFEDFELIISDNASTDNTSNICLEYSAKDNRIRYIRQKETTKPWINFKYVLDEAQADYFMWNAHDDYKSPDYIELNYNFLTSNPEYVASTCPNKFETFESDVSFSLDEDDMYERYVKFFTNVYFSHGIFYSLIRRNILIECDPLNDKFEYLGLDWCVDMFLLTNGKINLTDTGFTYFHGGGFSLRPNNVKLMQSLFIERLIPYYRFGKYVMRLSKCLSFVNQMKTLNLLIKMNIQVLYLRLRYNVKSILIFFHLMQPRDNVTKKT